MRIFSFLVIIFSTFIIVPGFAVVTHSFETLPVELSGQDTLKENQILYNGKIWSNIYYMVEGDQFFYSRMFLPGSLTIKGEKFTNIPLKYDILNDEILTPADTGGILQLNKEMVDSFSIIFQDRTYRFVRMQEDSTRESNRYFNVLYEGKTALYLRYSKKIDKTPVEGHNDRFYELIRIYFVKGNTIFPIGGKSDLLKVLNKDKALIKNFIRKNKPDISEKVPESFIPVIKFYDSISH